VRKRLSGEWPRSGMPAVGLAGDARLNLLSVEVDRPADGALRTTADRPHHGCRLQLQIARALPSQDRRFLSAGTLDPAVLRFEARAHPLSAGQHEVKALRSHAWLECPVKMEAADEVLLAI